jgi:HSP20 family molecular chaperone IbpA
MAVLAVGESLLPANATMRETDVEYVVDVDVSGFALSDLHVEIEDHVVTIRGESLGYALDESISLPLDADVEWPRALYEPGQLELRVPRLGSCNLGRRPVEIHLRNPVPSKAPARIGPGADVALAAGGNRRG